MARWNLAHLKDRSDEQAQHLMRHYYLRAKTAEHELANTKNLLEAEKKALSDMANKYWNLRDTLTGEERDDATN